jgi:hypothetical protein
MNPYDGQEQNEPAQPTGPPVFIFPQIRPINLTVAQDTHLPSIKMEIIGICKMARGNPLFKKHSLTISEALLFPSQKKNRDSPPFTVEVFPINAA